MGRRGAGPRPREPSGGGRVEGARTTTGGVDVEASVGVEIDGVTAGGTVERALRGDMPSEMRENTVGGVDLVGVDTDSKSKAGPGT